MTGIYATVWKKPFGPESNNLSISCFLIGTGKIFHDIASRDNSDKGFIVIEYRDKVLLHRLVQQIFHFRTGIYRAVVLTALYFHDGDQLHIL